MNLKNYRDPQIIKQVVSSFASAKRPFKFMEVCGTHTMALGKWGLRKLLAENIKLISGPGCPVCITPSCVIDELISLPQDVTIATFGDLMRVPGSLGTLEQARARGMDVRTVYSPVEALELAGKKETIFVGVGFETTIPCVGYTLLEAKKQQLTNFSLLSLFKLIPPALEALTSDEEVEIDGYILPGHVSVITGTEAYSFLPEKYNIGGVVAGFEPLDIVIAVKKLMENVEDPKIINEYRRVVTSSGNKHAQQLINKIFKVTDALWRGLGFIPASGLQIKEEYAMFDAAGKYGLKGDKRQKDDDDNYFSSTFENLPHEHHDGKVSSISNYNPNKLSLKCRCSDVLKGKIIPSQCTLFEKICTPSNPVGPCMVSSEGSCAAYYQYETGNHELEM